MNNITDTIRSLQFGDSMLPVGAFSFSNGLESAIQTKIVHDVVSLEQFIETAVIQSATADGIALLEVHRATQIGDIGRIELADREVFTRKMNEEARSMTVKMGNKLVEMASVFLADPLLREWTHHIKQHEVSGTYPVGQGIIFAISGLSEQNAFAAHQYGIASMMLGAALRLMKVDHFETQSILFRVNSMADDLYNRIANSTLDDMATFSPIADIMAAIHVKANLRLFMN